MAELAAKCRASSPNWQNNFRVHRHNRQTQRRLAQAYRRPVIHTAEESLNAWLRLCLRRTVVLFRLGRVLAFLLLFFLQWFLLFRVFLLQLLRLLLMLLLYLLFLSLIRLLLREFRVILLLLLLDRLAFLLLLRVELFLLLLVLRVQLWVRGGGNNGPWGSRISFGWTAGVGAGRFPGADCDVLFGFIGRSAGRSTGRFVGSTVFGAAGLFSTGLAVLGGIGRSAGRSGGRVAFGATACGVLVAGTGRFPCCG